MGQATSDKQRRDTTFTRLVYGPVIFDEGLIKALAKVIEEFAGKPEISASG